METPNRRRFLAAAATVLGTGSVAAGSARRTHPAWERTLGGETMGSFADVRHLSDGYLLVGTARDDGYATEGWTVKLTPGGDVAWERRYLSADHREFLERDAAAGPEPQDGLEFVLPADGGHLLVGWTYYDGPAVFVGWLVRIDEAGERVWERTLSDLEDASAYSYLADGVVTDDGYLLCGIESPGTMLGGGGWLVAVDDRGDVDWHRRYPATERDLAETVRRDTFRTIVETEAGYVVAGDYEPDPKDTGSRAWLVGVDERGDVRWEDDFALRTDAANRVYDLEPTDYGYLAVGAAGEHADAASEAFRYDPGIDGDGFVTAYTDAGERRWLRERDGTPMYCAETASSGVVAGGASDGRGWIGTVERTDLEAARPSAVTGLTGAHDGELLAAGQTTDDDVEGWVGLLTSDDEDRGGDADGYRELASSGRIGAHGSGCRRRFTGFRSRNGAE